MQRFPHTSKQHPTVQQGTALGQRDKVGQPRAGIDGHHVGRDPALHGAQEIVPSPAQPLLHVPVRPAFLVGQQVGVFIQVYHEVGEGKAPVLYDLLDPVPLVLVVQAWIVPDAVDLLPDALVSRPVAYLRGQGPQALDVVRLVDHVRHALDVTVEALHGVVCRVEAQALLRVPEPADAGPEGVRHAVNGGRKGRDLCSDAQRPAELSHDPVAVTRLEVGEVPLPVVDRFVSVPDSGVVHLLEQFVIDGSELRHGGPDFLLIQVRVLFPQVVDHRLPFLQGLSVPDAPAASALLDHADVVLRLSQQLHGMGLGHRVPLRHISGEVHGAHLIPIPVFQAVCVRRRPMDRREVGLDDLIRQLFVRHNIPDVPLHGLPGIQDAGLLILPLVGGLQQLLRLGAQAGLPALVPLPQQA